MGLIHQIQDKGKQLMKLQEECKWLYPVNGPQIGRQLNEGDVFYTYLNSRQAKMLLERFNNKLNEEEKADVWIILSALRRNSDPSFGYL